MSTTSNTITPRASRFVTATVTAWAVTAWAAAALAQPAMADAPLKPLKAVPEPSFSRLHDYQEISDLLRGYAAAFPGWVKLESIGKSGEGRDLWLATLTNPGTGDPLSKPAIYIDGNTHANEVQGAEATLYTLDFLLKNYGTLERATELVDRLTFYFLPVVNPDSRHRWFHEPSNADFPRTVVVPIDDDRDGLADEDGYDDLDGDGEITQMRKKVPLGQGDFLLDAKDSRILRPVKPDELGDYVVLGVEGFDNDGDGRVNEDTIGYVDPNRTGGYGWQPRYVQAGSTDYPLQIPETRSIARWFLQHPNVGAAQSFHNNGGMILRGPDAKIDPPYPAADIKTYDLIGKTGEKMLPGYRYIISWKDLYTVYGGTTEHYYRLHGAISFTNEMYEAPTDLDGDGETTPEEANAFDDLLTLGRQQVKWKPVEHPQYGKVEVGGERHDVGRVPEGWMLSEEVHRNSLFVLHHASELPRLSFGKPVVRKVDRNLWRVHLPVLNDRGIPTVTAWAQANKIHRMDLATLTGAKVLASGIVSDPWLDKVELQSHRAERLEVPGVGGYDSKILFFLVEGNGKVTATYDSLKGGKIVESFTLEETEP